MTNLKNSKLEINYFSDLPSYSGIGSSSAFVVSLLNGLYLYKGKIISKRELANQAIFLEREYLKEPGGYQDQLTSTYGGLCLFEYYKKSIKKISIINNAKIKNIINHNFILVFTGITRDGTKIISKQIEKSKIEKNKLNIFNSQADEAINLLGDGSLQDFGILLKDAWELKKKKPGVTSDYLNIIYKKTLDAGSLGGKLLGAGGGGFFLCLVPNSEKIKFKKKMSQYDTIDVKISTRGAQAKFINF